MKEAIEKLNKNCQKIFNHIRSIHVFLEYNEIGRASIHDNLFTRYFMWQMNSLFDAAFLCPLLTRSRVKHRIWASIVEELSTLGSDGRDVTSQHFPHKAHRK